MKTPYGNFVKIKSDEPEPGKKEICPDLGKTYIQINDTSIFLSTTCFKYVTSKYQYADVGFSKDTGELMFEFYEEFKQGRFYLKNMFSPRLYTKSRHIFSNVFAKLLKEVNKSVDLSNISYRFEPSYQKGNVLIFDMNNIVYEQPRRGYKKEKTALK